MDNTPVILHTYPKLSPQLWITVSDPGPLPTALHPWLSFPGGTPARLGRQTHRQPPGPPRSAA